MAIFRKVHTSFWSDPFIEDLDRDKKLFYIYILTNDKTRQCGIYEISKKQIAYDLGYSIDTVSKLLSHFIKVGKIKYNETTKELAVKNWLKYNGSTSPTVKSCIDREFTLVKDRLLIQYLYSTDTELQEEQEEEQEKKEEELEEEKEQDADFEILIYPTFEDFWNLYDLKKGDKDKIKKKFDDLTQKVKEDIMNYLPLYIKSTPDKQYRKHPETFINNKSWNDEIIFKKNGTEKGNNDEFLKAIYDEYNASKSK